MLPYMIGADGAPRPWRSTTLRQIGKDESFLEKLIAADPLLLGLDPYESGITGRIVAFRQAQLLTPTGRTVIPDVVLLSETGHIVVVEAKLGDNPELKGRQVIAQVVEYAASVANLSDSEALEWLGDDRDESWTDMVRRTFPGAVAPDRLAETLRRRMRDAEIHLVIVCDGAPDGLRELVKSVAGQAALGAFQLHVVELAPYVADGVDGVLLVPSAIVRTEIVARTAVTVSYVAGIQQPAVSVVASSVEEVEKAIEEARAGKVPRPEFAAVISAYDAEAAVDLRTFGKSAAYKQVRPRDWPAGVHYEFLDKSGGQDNVGVELHLESKGLAGLSPGLLALAQRLREKMPDVSHDPKWGRGLGRIFVRVPIADAASASRMMATFIEMTRAEVNQLLLECRAAKA
jgi:hypothetical protein